MATERKGDDLADRLLTFAANVGQVVNVLPDCRMGRHVAGQLIRCGTASAPNYAEARGAESTRDFIHKLSICLKELRETDCWVRLVVRAKLLADDQVVPLINECDQLIRILVQSIVTAKNRKPAR